MADIAPSMLGDHPAHPGGATMNAIVIGLHSAGVINDAQMVAFRRLHREWSVSSAAPGGVPADEHAAATAAFMAAMRGLGRNGAAVALAVICQAKPLSAIPKIVGCKKAEAALVLVACGEKLVEHYDATRRES